MNFDEAIKTVKSILKRGTQMLTQLKELTSETYSYFEELSLEKFPVA